MIWYIAPMIAWRKEERFGFRGSIKYCRLPEFDQPSESFDIDLPLTDPIRWIHVMWRSRSPFHPSSSGFFRGTPQLCDDIDGGLSSICRRGVKCPQSWTMISCLDLPWTWPSLGTWT